MIADRTNPESAGDAFLADLTATILDVAHHFDVKGPSVDLEIGLWHELDAVLRDWRSRAGRASATWDERVAVLTAVAYRVVLQHHFRGAFVDLEMDLWHRLRQVIRRNRILLATGADAATKPGARSAQHLSGVLAIA
jgi:hypothetical protein